MPRCAIALFSLLLILPASAPAQQRVAKLHYDFATHGGLVPDTTGSAADTLRANGNIPAGAIIYQLVFSVTDSLKSLHGDSAQIAVKADTTSLKGPQNIGTFAATEVPAAADSLLAPPAGKPKRLPRSGPLNVIVSKWPLTKGAFDVWVFYLKP